MKEKGVKVNVVGVFLANRNEKENSDAFGQ